jgi:hypothetical protein
VVMVFDGMFYSEFLTEVVGGFWEEKGSSCS